MDLCSAYIQVVFSLVQFWWVCDPIWFEALTSWETACRAIYILWAWLFPTRNLARHPLVVNFCIQNVHLPQRLHLYFMGCHLHFFVFLLVCQTFVLKVLLPIPHTHIMRVLFALVQHARHVYRWKSKLCSVLSQKLFKRSARNWLKIFVPVLQKSFGWHRCLIWLTRQRGPHSVLVRRRSITPTGPVSCNGPGFWGLGLVQDLCGRTVKKVTRCWVGEHCRARAYLCCISDWVFEPIYQVLHLLLFGETDAGHVALLHVLCVVHLFVCH